MKVYIYKIENVVTGQCYIGQTVDLKRRKRTHINQLRNKTHVNLKLQNAWDKYGETNFSFENWVFYVDDLSELDKLECDFIEKFNSLKDGYNLIEGGGKPPSRQKISNEDVVKFLCVFHVYGEGYGKTFEAEFGWSHGTASSIQRRVRFIEAIRDFDEMSEDEKIKLGIEIYHSHSLEEKRLKRAVKQGGAKKAYQLTQDDFNFAFTARELGFTYTEVAMYFKISPSTAKDWYNGRSRVKNKLIFDSLTSKEKELLVGRVKIAELSRKPKS